MLATFMVNTLGRCCSRRDALFPWLLLGIVPAALSVALKNICLLLFALVNVVLAGADTAVALRATTCRANLLLDHYERAGFYAFSK